MVILKNSLMVRVLDRLHSITSFIQYVWRENHERSWTGYKHGRYQNWWQVNKQLRYADHTTLAATGEERLRQLIRSVQNASGKYGLYLNVDKTKVMTTANIDSFIMDGKRIEVVNSFNFLCSAVERTGGCTKEIRRRIGLGKAAMMNCQKYGRIKVY